MRSLTKVVIMLTLFAGVSARLSDTGGVPYIDYVKGKPVIKYAKSLDKIPKLKFIEADTPDFLIDTVSAKPSETVFVGLSFQNLQVDSISSIQAYIQLNSALQILQLYSTGNILIQIPSE